MKRTSPGRTPMRHRIFFIALGTLLTACQETERPLAPTPDGPRFSSSASQGLNGTIVFHSNRNGDHDIYTMNADGSGVTQLTSNIGNNFWPSWSPNGQTISFFGGPPPFGCCDIKTIKRDGTGLTLLTHDDGQFSNILPSWSPSGQRIVFSSDRAGTFDIYVINPDGTGLTQLTSSAGQNFSAYWSPDGRRIAFQSDRNGN